MKLAFSYIAMKCKHGINLQCLNQVASTGQVREPRAA